MKKYTDADVSHMRWRLFSKLGFVKSALIPIPQNSTTATRMWLLPKSPTFDFFWAPETDRQKAQIIVTFVGKYGPVGMSEDEDMFPSDELVAKIRLVML